MGRLGIAKHLFNLSCLLPPSLLLDARGNDAKWKMEIGGMRIEKREAPWILRSGNAPKHSGGNMNIYKIRIKIPSHTFCDRANFYYPSCRSVFRFNNRMPHGTGANGQTIPSSKTTTSRPSGRSFFQASSENGNRHVWILAFFNLRGICHSHIHSRCTGM